MSTPRIQLTSVSESDFEDGNDDTRTTTKLLQDTHSLFDYSEHEESVTPIDYMSGYIRNFLQSSCIKLVSDVDNGADGEDDGRRNEEKFAWFELYFDLIFVAFILELGFLLKVLTLEDGSARKWQHYGETILLFVTGWLTWAHSNMIMTRFRVHGAFRFLIFLMSAFTIMVASLSVVVDTESSGTDEYYNSGARRRAPMIFLLGTRICFALLYVAAVRFEESTRAMCKWYIYGFLISCAILLTGSCIGHHAEADSREFLWTAAVLVEMIMYPLTSYLTPEEDQLPIDMDHNIERNELWIVIVIGESMLSLVTTPRDLSASGVDFYFTMALAIGIVIELMRIYEQSQPEHEIGFDQHANDISTSRGMLFNFFHLLISIGLFMVGVALKFFMTYVKEPEKEKTLYAVMFTSGISIALFFINMARCTHKWGSYPVLGYENGRTYLLVLHHALSFGIFPLGFTVANKAHRITTTPTPSTLPRVRRDDTNLGESDYTYEQTGLLSPLALLGTVLAFLLIIDIIETLLEVPPFVFEVFEQHRKQRHTLARADSGLSSGTVHSRTTTSALAPMHRHSIRYPASEAHVTRTVAHETHSIGTVHHRRSLPAIAAPLRGWALVRSKLLSSHSTPQIPQVASMADVVHHMLETHRHVRVPGQLADSLPCFNFREYVPRPLSSHHSRTSLHSGSNVVRRRGSDRSLKHTSDPAYRSASLDSRVSRSSHRSTGSHRRHDGFLRFFHHHHQTTSAKGHAHSNEHLDVVMEDHARREEATHSGAMHPSALHHAHGIRTDAQPHRHSLAPPEKHVSFKSIPEPNAEPSLPEVHPAAATRPNDHTDFQREGLHPAVVKSGPRHISVYHL
eukprot:m.422178 g.422178  ORF g.422178 m.422178 type:complete len:852 (-) comp21327_c0_seq1:259-2814(-)